MKTVCTLADLRAETQALRQRGSIGLVPTMGALHEGHLALVRAARAMCDSVVVSVFVNPTQFGPNEDLAVSPRQLAEDSAMLEAEGAELPWAPGVAAKYPARPRVGSDKEWLVCVAAGGCVYINKQNRGEQIVHK